MLVLNLPFKALMFLTLMRPSLVLFLVLWLKLVKDFLKVRCRLALLPFLISCLIWLDVVASLPLIKERILVIILLLHFLSLMLFFFQAEDGIRDLTVTGVQTCALPIYPRASADGRFATRCCLSAFPRPDGQIARSGRPPNHKVRPPCARRLPTAPAGPPCGREIAARRLELGAVAQQ